MLFIEYCVVRGVLSLVSSSLCDTCVLLCCHSCCVLSAEYRVLYCVTCALCCALCVVRDVRCES